MLENLQGKDKPYEEFWEITLAEKSPPQCYIHTALLLRFCSEHLGYYNYVDYTGNYILVKCTDHCVITECKVQDLKQDLKNFLLYEAEEHLVWSTFTKSNLINEHFLHLLDKLPESDFNVSTKEEAFFFYRNGVLKVSPKSISILAYSEFKGTVWSSQIIQRDFYLMEEGANDCDFDKFLKNITNQKQDRFLSLVSILGYMLHPYKDPSFTKCVILLDENIDFTGEANGGTGKSLLAKALEKITPTVWKDGKKFNPNSVFVYDDIRPYHRILYFDDVKRSFSFEDFYALISGNLKTERKYKDSTTIPAKFTPKLLISSNYMVTGTGGETEERRKIEFEIFPHYSMALTPRDEFQRNFFDDWDLEEWQKFDNYMCRTVKFFMNRGVLSPIQINLKENKLRVATDPEFVLYMDSVIVELDKAYDKAVLLNDFIKLCPKHKNLSAISFKKWIDKWIEARGLFGDHRKSNSHIMVLITTHK